jgi:hypothetical protein
LSIYAFDAKQWNETKEREFIDSSSAWSLYVQEIAIRLATKFDPLNTVHLEEIEDIPSNHCTMNDFVLSLKSVSGILTKIPFSPNSTFNELEKLYRAVNGIDSSVAYQFFFDGEKLDLTKTPMDFQMEHEDCIEVGVQTFSKP